MKGHLYQWLAGGYDLEIGHFWKWLAWWLLGGQWSFLSSEDSPEIIAGIEYSLWFEPFIFFVCFSIGFCLQPQADSLLFVAVLLLLQPIQIEEVDPVFQIGV